MIATVTGARKGELMQRTWNEVNLDKGIIYLIATKNETNRAIPLLPKALRLLKQRHEVRRVDDDRIFVGPRSGLSFPESQ